MLPPSIEPTATQHIQEQIEIIEQIITNGYAYQVNGSVYFDTRRYMQDYNYGILSGRKVDELENETRTLNAQDEKRFFADFALWKKSNPDDMQVWRSPWGNGNPGWHIECTAMSTKYLGKQFDIHGGGMDLKFPHHEDEIAQSCGSFGCNPARYWMHANMLNVNGQKMSKSFGNYFLPKQILDGSTGLFEKSYTANVVRFFMMQAHYRSNLDFTQEALNASEKGYLRLMEGLKTLDNIQTTASTSFDVAALVSSFYKAMNDDFNAPILVAQLFEAVKHINLINDGNASISIADKSELKAAMEVFIHDVLGLATESNATETRLAPVMDLVLDLRQQARANKDWTTSDQIRDGLAKAGIIVKDAKDGTTWN
jgi:cysteinyl-tRNA synthetase